ncbi:hypothetical protein CKO11_06630 [Rhodobacter sp. TJ_12]|uniref:class I SAM-dependent methyltransferase n=1 Tax=Rhodobacter sp. TJ_12 TaxID=2029399 RepID=UPI001CBFB325|nr:class I SAM-dependent methyltransferase [Rhodobacter sp. TJ_12]MBZ4022133.1 hypothetical protein [Rhodobacter sp. TJ_12]
MKTLEEMQISGASLSTRGMMLMGYQRTKQVSPAARKAWEAGQPETLEAEVIARRDEIFTGTLQEVYDDYVPLRAALADMGRSPKTVIDIGCGQALNDALLVKDFGCAVTLVDIEETPSQYHNWNASGSGYASLAEAEAFLKANGAQQVTSINPLKSPEKMTALASADLVTSLISCGFHYPIGDYVDLFLNTVNAGGLVVLDIRRRYHRNPDAALQKLLFESKQKMIESTEHKAHRLIFHG